MLCLFKIGHIDRFIEDVATSFRSSLGPLFDGLGPAVTCLCKARKEAHAAQASLRKAYMGAQAAVAVWRAPSQAVLRGASAAVREICLRSWPMG